MTVENRRIARERSCSLHLLFASPGKRFLNMPKYYCIVIEDTAPEGLIEEVRSLLNSYAGQRYFTSHG